MTLGDHQLMARRVLQAAGLSSRGALTRAAEGIGNHVFLTADSVVRLGTGSDGAMFPRAAAILRAVGSKVAVPEVLYDDCSCATFPVPVMVLTRVAGEPLSRTWPTMAVDDRLHMLHIVAAELDRLHGLRPADVPGAGFTVPWWRARVDRIHELLHRLRGKAEIPAEWFDRMERYVADNEIALEEAPESCVLHNDVNWGNVLIANGRVAALLDFDDALAGPPEEDAWGLLFASELDGDAPWTNPRELQQLPGFDLSTGGVLERFRIIQIADTLDLLSGELSWVAPEVAVDEAREIYRDAFMSDRYERLLERIL